jgi:hypothetical protein
MENKKKYTRKQQGITMFINPALHEGLKEIFKYKSPGAIVAIEGFLEIRKAIVPSIVKKFTPSELICLIDSFDYDIAKPKFMANKNMYISMLENNDKEYGLSSMYNVSMFEIIEKIYNMNAAEVYFLIDVIRVYKEKLEDNEDLIDFIERITKDE